MIWQCVVVTRELRGGSRIVEAERAFSTVEELFAYCVSLENPNLRDRVSIAGDDRDGRPRVLTFTFQSITSPATR